MAWDKKYYLNINDQNVGPLSFEEIADRLKNGLLKPEDYIFIIGDKDWKNISELEEFKLYIVPEDPESRKIWFIRKNKKNEGPYSKKELLNMIETGLADINDYVWSKELRNWTSIKDSFMIQTPATTQEDPTPVPQPQQDTPAQPQEQESDMDKTPVVEMRSVQNNIRTKRVLPEIILGSALLLVGLYQSQTKLITSIVLSTVGALLLLISIYESRSQQGDK